MQVTAMENTKCMERYTKYRSLLFSADRVFVYTNCSNASFMTVVRPKVPHVKQVKGWRRVAQNYSWQM